MSTSTLGIGLAGLGQHGLRYARHLVAQEVRGAELRAVWTRRSDKARGFARKAREEGARVDVCESLEALAQHPEVDLVVAVLPPSAHPDALAASAAADKAVLVEKPLANDLDAARRACEIGGALGGRAGVAHTLRFNTTVQTLARALPRIGRLHMLALDQRFEPTERSWLDDPREGGLLLNTGCHGADLLHFLTGATIVSATARARTLVTARCEDVFAAIVELEPGGIVATLDNSRAAGGRSGRIECVGDRGILRADHVHGTLELVEGRTRQGLPLPPAVHTVQATLQASADALLAGRPLPVSLEEGRLAVEGVEIIRDALRAYERGPERA